MWSLRWSGRETAAGGRSGPGSFSAGADYGEPAGLPGARGAAEGAPRWRGPDRAVRERRRRASFQSLASGGGRRRTRVWRAASRAAARSPGGSRSKPQKTGQGGHWSSHAGSRVAVPAVEARSDPGGREGSGSWAAERASMALSTSRTAGGGRRNGINFAAGAH